jgi:hypothetical protein
MPVTVHVAPDAGAGIEILTTFDVDEHTPLSALEDERLVFGHLREGVPNDLAIPLAKLVKRWRAVLGGSRG